MKLTAREIVQFQKKIFGYYRKHKRDLPWRPPSLNLRKGEARDPWKILVSEFMLQQTQAKRVIPFFKKFIRQFPSARVLAVSPRSEAVRAWQGLGYNRRALYLKRAAEIMMREYDGEVPRDAEKLDALPGIGPYTAAAVMAFAWGEPVTFIETNIRTVYLHFFFNNQNKVRDEKILKLVEQTLPSKVQPFSRSKIEPLEIRVWYSALMDYGAMLKKTLSNVNRQSAHYARQNAFIGSRRELRGKIILFLSRVKKMHILDIARETGGRSDDVSSVLSELAREGFLRNRQNFIALA